MRAWREIAADAPILSALTQPLSVELKAAVGVVSPEMRAPAGRSHILRLRKAKARC
jgi:hypothetical protein